LLPRVINSKTKLFWLKLSSNKRPRKLILKNYKLNKMLEDKRINKEEKEELTNQKDYDLVDYYLNI
jgi:hypothetical protein